MTLDKGAVNALPLFFQSQPAPSPSAENSVSPEPHTHKRKVATLIPLEVIAELLVESPYDANLNVIGAQPEKFVQAPLKRPQLLMEFHLS